MNEPRYINANELKDTLDYYISEAGWTAAHNEALTWVKDEFIDAVKTADVAPVVHGRWIYSDKYMLPECTLCRGRPFKGYIPSLEEVKQVYKFCPVCGAKMDESEGDNEKRN